MAASPCRAFARVSVRAATDQRELYAHVWHAQPPAAKGSAEAAPAEFAEAGLCVALFGGPSCAYAALVAQELGRALVDTRAALSGSGQPEREAAARDALLLAAVVESLFDAQGVYVAPCANLPLRLVGSKASRLDALVQRCGLNKLLDAPAEAARARGESCGPREGGLLNCGRSMLHRADAVLRDDRVEKHVPFGGPAHRTLATVRETLSGLTFVREGATPRAAFWLLNGALSVNSAVAKECDVLITVAVPAEAAERAPDLRFAGFVSEAQREGDALRLRYCPPFGESELLKFSALRTASAPPLVELEVASQFAADAAEYSVRLTLRRFCSGAVANRLGGAPGALQQFGARLLADSPLRCARASAGEARREGDALLFCVGELDERGVELTLRTAASAFRVLVGGALKKFSLSGVTVKSVALDRPGAELEKGLRHELCLENYEFRVVLRGDE